MAVNGIGTGFVPLVDEGLGNSSYLVDLGDGRGLVVDPSRDLRAVRAAAEARGLRPAFVADTHLHADFLSGAVQLAATDGARVLASAAGGREFEHMGLRDGDEVDLGGLRLRTLATPGHTVEHLAFVLLDGAAPLGVFTGGSLLVGAVARTDLVDPARTEELARAQYTSVRRLLDLGDDTAVAATALATGYLAARHGLRPAPFLLGIAYAALGLGLSAFLVRETRGHAHTEAARLPTPSHPRTPTSGDANAVATSGQVFTRTSFTEPALSSASQAGMVNNLNDGLAWGLFPVLFAAHGISLAGVGILAALYPAVWGAGQLFTGALSDRIGRKPLIVTGMSVQAAALALVALGNNFAVWAIAQVLLGAGTAMVYPTLLAAVGDVAHPAWRARSVGVYRLWRDGGFAVGALLGGLIADLYGIPTAIWTVAALTAISGAMAAARMYETHPRTQQ